MKAGGTYNDIAQGVSNKEPQHRRPGQTSEQVNILSDVKYGLVRRRGTRYAASQSVVLAEGAAEELNKMDVFDFTIEGRDYALVYRRKASALGADTFAFLYDKEAEEFIPINYESSTWVDNLISGGASALAAIGRYVYIAGNTTYPAASQANLWDTEANQNKLAAWFRVGKYSTTYKVTLIEPDGTRLTKEYTTKPAAYPGVLDTSAIPFFEVDGTTPRPEYQKDVNDAVNAYNSLVNEWIKEAAEDIVPQNIAEQLAILFAVDGVIVTSFENGGLLFNDPDYVDIEVDDGGDNTTVYRVGKEITEATRVTKYHWHGKIVRVRPQGAGADEAFYLEARLDSGETSGFGAVSWFEVNGVSASITNFVAQLIIHTDGEAYVAQDGAGLLALAPTSGPHPPLDARVVGDGLTSPLPYFIGKPITMLAVFQDRLIVGSDNVVSTSRSGDYLNFFRGSVVTISDSDPVEVFALGSEGDILRAAALYNRSLIIFGKKRQYGIDGSQLLTPRSPLIFPLGANEDSTDSNPVVSGNFIFYGQYGDNTTSMHQLRVGALNATQTVTDELSEELGEWLNGTPVQLCALTAPNLVLFRTTGQQRGFYVYRYEDNKNNGQRLLASWFRMQYAEALGTVIGISSYRKAGIIFTARNSKVVADVLSFSTEPDTMHANLDSWAPYGPGSPQDVADEDMHAVVDGSSEHFLLGTPLVDVATFLEQLPEVEDALHVGVVSEGWVTPTNPFPRDQNGKAVLDGRMSLNRVTVDVKNTAGMIGEVSTKAGTVKTTDFEGRILGSSDNIIAQQPRFEGKLSIGVGKEITECSFTLRTKDWLPMTVTGLAWVGQTFNNVRRVS